MSAQDKHSLQERGRFKSWWDAARPLDGSAFPYEIAWAAWQVALDARQPVGEPVFRERPTHNAYRGSFSGPCRCWADADHAVGNEVMRYAAPPAQAVDLGQFRDLAEFALSNAKLHNCWEKREALARELLALIDGKAVGK